jgi:predicted transcriptional regulator of viral defense system
MKSRSYVADERALTALAATQGGFFTAKQAALIGYTAPKRNYHVHAGNWVRERRGIFRIASQPLPARPDLILWWLWSRNRLDQPQGTFSHQTALSLHELTDAMPARIHMTVQTGFRRGAAIPKALILHVADLVPSEVEQLDGVPVTKPLRTLIDVAISGDVPIDDLQAAFSGAARSGKITRAEIHLPQADPLRNATLQILQAGGR